MASDGTLRQSHQKSAGGDREDTFQGENAAMREDVKNATNAARDALNQGASRIVSAAQEKAREGAESGKAVAIESIRDFTAAIRRASDELGNRDQSLAADLVRRAASGLEQTAEALQGKSVDDLARSITSFARRQPAAFLVGATLTGVALGRFARASADHGTDEDMRDYRSWSAGEMGQSDSARASSRSSPMNTARGATAGAAGTGTSRTTASGVGASGTAASGTTASGTPTSGTTASGMGAAQSPMKGAPADGKPGGRAAGSDTMREQPGGTNVR
ncbi:hypothetical protein [Rhodoligotrophos defluvii]|uniref:hypothetical protein n=1 Tax=Rhodoligotrophos defluvii TaxID=2561934 RepID=UPI0010C98F01|nr:hypothetical protein [Rhodoligotrophos defluvii]